MSKFVQRSDARYDAQARTWHYEVVALSVPIIFNRDRDHDRNGMLYALATHRPELEQLASKWRALAEAPKTVAELAEFTAHPLVRPLVLRARVGDVMEVRFTNHLPRRWVGMHLVAPGTDVSSDGSEVGSNASSLACPGETVVYRWRCHHEGCFVFHDIGDPDGDETGSNAHGLFGALIVEPRHAWWTDPTQEIWFPSLTGCTWTCISAPSRRSEIRACLGHPFPARTRGVRRVTRRRMHLFASTCCSSTTSPSGASY